MNKKDVITFFDKLAPSWDADMVRSDEIINTILDNAGVGSGSGVLDVACGTGVLFPDYLSRDVAHITAIDFSPAMIEIAESKLTKLGPESGRFTLICDDVETYGFDSEFDNIVVYNSFPHFPEPERIIRRLSSLLAKGGTLTVAHGMSREAIDRHHSGRAASVSVGLLTDDELAAIFSKYLNVTVKISSDRMYQVAGVRK